MNRSPIGELQNRPLFWRNLQACHSSTGCAHDFKTGKSPEEVEPGWSRTAERAPPPQAVAHSFQGVCTKLYSRVGVTHLHNARLLVQRLPGGGGKKCRSRAVRAWLWWKRQALPTHNDSLHQHFSNTAMKSIKSNAY